MQPVTQYKPEQRKLYNRHWEKVRKAQLSREPWCKDCLAAGVYTPATEVHHVQRHEGDLLIFAISPLESLCKACHTRRTAGEVFSKAPKDGKQTPGSD